MRASANIGAAGCLFFFSMWSHSATFQQCYRAMKYLMLPTEDLFLPNFWILKYHRTVKSDVSISQYWRIEYFFNCMLTVLHFSSALKYLVLPAENIFMPLFLILKYHCTGKSDASISQYWKSQYFFPNVYWQCYISAVLQWYEIFRTPSEDLFLPNFWILKYHRTVKSDASISQYWSSKRFIFFNVESKMCNWFMRHFIRSLSFKWKSSTT